MKTLKCFLFAISTLLISCDLVSVTPPPSQERVTETPRLREVSLFFAPHEGGVEKEKEAKMRTLISTKIFGEGYPQYPDTIDLREGTIQLEVITGPSIIQEWIGSLEIRNFETEELLWQRDFAKEDRILSLPNVFLQKRTSVRIYILGADEKTIYEYYRFTLFPGS